MRTDRKERQLLSRRTKNAKFVSRDLKVITAVKIHVVGINVSEDRDASRMAPRNVGTFHITARCHNLQNHNMNFYHPFLITKVNVTQ
jgi:hypothetical protein